MSNSHITAFILATCKLLLTIYEDRLRWRLLWHNHLTRGRVNDGGGEGAVGKGHLGLLLLRLKLESFSLNKQN